MTDQEIGIVKAMLSKGMRNDAIHFYFNRADRLLSSGRIAQIRKKKYGASVVEASPDELESFLADWQARQRTNSSHGTISPVAPGIISAMFIEKDDVWTMHQGETDQIECKKTFRLSPEERFADVIRSIAGLANNKGGYIFFGVRDRNFTADGLSDTTFFDSDPALINRSLSGALDPVPHVTKSSITFGKKRIGVLYVEKHEHAPVIAIKNIAQDVKEGTIYFRYVGETRAIKPGELRQIIANREQRAVAEFILIAPLRIDSPKKGSIPLDTFQRREMAPVGAMERR
jgi:Putative DNA-binding domain